MRLIAALLSFMILLGSSPILAQNILIKNAQIIDGSGKAGFYGDVRIVGDIIKDIGTLTATPKDTVIDAQGLTLSPGFVDSHSHHDFDLDNNRAMLAALSQGITTVIIGQDGGMNWPLDGFFKDIENNPIGVNLASFVGHNSLRQMVMGERSTGPATANDIDEMKNLLSLGMQAGALGLSTGLEYEPGIYSKTDEVIELSKVAKSYGGLYTSHIRSEDRHVYQALKELVTIGQQADIPVHVSHIKLAMPSLWGQAQKALEILENGIADGVDISAEVYPYTHWQSTMQVILPERNLDDHAAVSEALRNLLPPEDMLFSTYSLDKSVEGKTLAELAIERDMDPVDLYIKLAKDIEAAQESGDDSARESIIGRGMAEEDIAAFMQWPHTSFCSDGSHAGHPRGHGAFARIMGHYVRDMKVLDLPTAIHKASHKTAQRFGLKNRGLIAPNHKADLILFDPETIIDNATFKNPTEQSSGISVVWVNGKIAFENGKATTIKNGTLLKR